VLFSGVLTTACDVVLLVVGAARVVAVRGSGRPGGEAGEGLAAPFAGFGGRPRAARRWFSSCRVFQAGRMRWLRTTSSTVVDSVRGVRPMRRHQPRLMLLAAGSLAVAKPRSAPVRRA
jgi:hypothetical protein